MNRLFILLIAGGVLSACNGGGGSSGGSNPSPSPTPSPTPTINPNSVDPYPYPTPSTYPTMPDGFAAAVPTFMSNSSQAGHYGLQIAYGHNTNPQAPNLVAYINQLVNIYQNPDYNGLYICSATPVESDGNGGTWLVGAAHCYLSQKSSFAVVTASDILPMVNLSVYKGGSGQINKASSVQVFVPKNYCQGATFDYLGECPNFGSYDGGEGNDIALIHINAKFNDDQNYPRLAESSEYPSAYAMAPVLSLGFGLTNKGGMGDMFYVVNYFYQQSDDTGYHYLYNSYFNPYAGYSELVCGGDSGGGDLYWNGNQWLLLSEHTYGPSDSCGNFYNYLPNGATNVSAYYSWLTNIINSGSGGATAYCNSESANCVTNG